MARTRALFVFACVVVLAGFGVWWLAADGAGSVADSSRSDALADGGGDGQASLARSGALGESGGAPAAPVPRATLENPTGLGLRDSALVDHRALSATVTLRDEQGAALSDGFLSAVTNDGAELARAQADESGRVRLEFVLDDTYAGEFRDVAFEFGAPGRARLRVNYRSGADLFELGTIQLAEAHVLSGRLVANDGRPRSGVRVGVKPYKAPSPKPKGAASLAPSASETRTDAEGRFEFAGLDSLVNARILAPGRRGAFSEITPYVGHDGLFAEGATRHDLGDVVWPDAPPLEELLRVRLVDEHGAPLAEARAALHSFRHHELLPDGPDKWLRSASVGELADAEGWVVVRARPAWVTAPMLGVVVAAPGRQVRLLSLPEARDAEIELPIVTPLRLAFADAETQAPLVGFDARVKRYDGYGFKPGPWTTIQPDVEPGGWILRDPARRELRLEFSKPGFGRRRVALAAELPRGPVQRFELPGPRRVSFRVLDTARELRRDTRAVLSGPMSAPQAGRQYITALQLEDGSFVARGAVPGEATLTLSTPDKTAPNSSFDVVVGGANATELGEFIFASYGEVLLTMRGADGELVDVEPLESYAGEGSVYQRKRETLDDGRLRYYRLRPGLWRFELEPGGLVEVEVEPEGRHEAELWLERWARLEGRVLRDGEPVPGAIVAAIHGEPTQSSLEDLSGSLLFQAQLSWATARRSGHTLSDEEGYFALELPAADLVSVIAADESAHRTEVMGLTTVLGEAQRLDLQIPPGEATLEGLARHHETGEPVAEAIILVDGLNVGLTDERGWFQITGLPERTVRVAARVEGVSLSDESQLVDLSVVGARPIELTVPESFPEGLFCTF